jgi:hypothetical protein
MMEFVTKLFHMSLKEGHRERIIILGAAGETRHVPSDGMAAFATHLAAYSIFSIFIPMRVKL